MTEAELLASLPTPSLVLDERRLTRNVDRLRARMDALGVPLRPHLETAKSVDVARRVLADGTGPATVSTLKEAEVFAGTGVKDVFYAVGVTPQKLDPVLALRCADRSRILSSSSRRRGRGIERPKLRHSPRVAAVRRLAIV